MNSGQTMLSLLAMVLLGTTVFTVNRNSLNNGTILRQTELGIYSVSLATSYIQKAKQMAFDEKTTGGLAISLPMAKPVAGTLSTTMGIETGTRYFTPPGGTMEPQDILNNDNTYDDFDDYNNFVKNDSIGGVDVFHVTARVCYTSQVPPFSDTTGATWLKRIVVKVNNSIKRSVYTNEVSTGTDTITFSYIKSFYF
jgi:hypothetical protein